MHRSRYPLVILLLVSALLAGCSQSGPVSVESKLPLPPRRGEVVATIAEKDPANALRHYLHDWMLDYNEQAPGEQQSASDVGWTPEKPDGFVSVMPAVSMTDFTTVTVWSASIKALEPVSKNHAAYSADFMFWRGNPLSSAGTGAVPLGASATYELSWDDGEAAWVITLTSEPPDDNLVESSYEETDRP